MTPAAAKIMLETKSDPEDPGAKKILVRIEQVLKRYDPDAADLGGKLKKPSLRETQASLHESEQSGNSNADAKRARSPRY